jgi:hypothetical protein
MSRELFLGTIFACVVVIGIVLYRMPHDEASRDSSIQFFRSQRGVGLVIGLVMIVLGCAQLYAGFHSGRMEIPIRHGPGPGFSISYNHPVIFGILGVFYSILVMSGLALVKMLFAPEIRTAPLFHSRLAGLAWLAIAAFMIFGIAS